MSRLIDLKRRVRRRFVRFPLGSRARIRTTSLSLSHRYISLRYIYSTSRDALSRHLRERQHSRTIRAVMIRILERARTTAQTEPECEDRREARRRPAHAHDVARTAVPTPGTRHHLLSVPLRRAEVRGAVGVHGKTGGHRRRLRWGWGLARVRLRWKVDDGGVRTTDDGVWMPLRGDGGLRDAVGVGVGVVV